MGIALLMLSFGALALWFGRHIYVKVKKEGAWPTTSGKLLERGVGEAMGRGRTYMPHAKYTYSVAGKEYVNDQVYLIRRTGGLHDKMQKLVDGLPDPVTVHYDAADPSRSFLLTNPLSTVWILFAFGAFATFGGLAQLLTLWTGSTVKAEAGAEPAAKSAPSPPIVEKPIDQIRKATTIREALEIAHPAMKDPFEKTDEGTLLLSAWAAKSMRWADVDSRDETMTARVLKSPDQERAKRLCVNVRLLDIAAQQTPDGKLFEGTSLDIDLTRFHFYAVASAGDLVADSRARLCGFVTGVLDSASADGGTSRAIKVVGMFDLPQNRSAPAGGL